MVPVNGKENIKMIEKKQTKKKEKERYVKALQALVYSKGDKGPAESDFPLIFQQLEDQLQASNSQLYKNEKEYQRAVKGILPSMQSTK